MNIDRGKTSFEPEEIAELQERLIAYRKSEGKTWGNLGKQIDVNPTTLQLWTTGKYNADENPIATKVFNYFRAEEQRVHLMNTAPAVPSFQETMTSRRIRALLDDARTGEWNIIVGVPGVGKTATFDQYCARVPNAYKFTAERRSKALMPMLKGLATVVLKATVRSTAAYTVSQIIRDHVRDANAVLIIDEAQHLNDDAVEELRAIHDDTGCGLVLAGNPKVLQLVEGVGRNEAFAQRSSRVGMRLDISKPEREDITMLLNAWRVEDEAARKFLTDIALKPGALRSLTKTMKLATKLAQFGDERLCLDHIKDARAQLTSRSVAA